MDDMAAACVHVMNLPKATYDQPHPAPCKATSTSASASDITIAELAQTVAAVVGYPGGIDFDPTQARRHPAQAHGQQPA